ncbi:hypothetical protein TL5118_04162 [Thalassovita autumnalis]|uniref:Uncharacterized protein n=1 Tax=Thalassovita autumnalis TaxID=2072972 RepID=A0A0P1FPK3_9RHOB|nr:hypothetical protein [Thalassovita autumnalis]CUH70187.1 hypothetical protein TL5118_04162 [Thalassovita autumnalis]CUH71883.1 hypothetical protein TL5120_01675 [Thalassovita autumnalis]
MNLGRSSLIRAGIAQAGRPRNWTRRWLSVLLLVSSFSWLCWAVASQWFDPSGPVRLLYVIHDVMWLPLYSAVWTAIFPWGVVWLLPVTLVSGLALLEFLGAWRVVRGFQTWVLRLLIVRNWHGLLLPSYSRVRRTGAVTLAEAVTLEEIEAIRRKIKQVPDEECSALVLKACQFVTLLIRLDAIREDNMVLPIEVLALCHWQKVQNDPAAMTLAQKLDTLWAAREYEPGLIAPFDWDVDRMIKVAGRLGRAGQTPQQMATNMIRAALGAGQHDAVVWGVWLDQWNRARLTGNTDMLHAECLIDFETWAYVCETSITAQPVGGFLSSVAGLSENMRPRGEVFSNKFKL